MNDPRTTFAPSTRRERVAWAFFDFANSSFTTIIVTVVYARYFVNVVVGEDGWKGLEGDTWWGLAGSVAKGLVILTAPVIGAMADRRAAKKRFLLVSWLLCVAATACLSFSEAGWVLPAMLFFIVANLAFATGENLVAGFLPELASGERMGRLSGFGAAIGYQGGLVSLVLALVLVQADLVPLIPLSAALFFFAAGLPTFLYLRERAIPRDDPGRSLIGEAFGELRQTFRERRRFRDLFRFLTALFFFQAGIEIVIAYAAIYAENEVGMKGEDIILLFIALQLAAGGGAFLVGHLQDRMGSRVALGVALATWCAAVLTAWLAYDLETFLVAGVLAGAGMGMSTAVCRTVIGLFCPRGREAEWFGLWGFTAKAAAVFGLLYYVLIFEATGDRRVTILATLGLFLLGAALLVRVDPKRGARAASAPTP